MESTLKVDLKPSPWIALSIGFIIYIWFIINNSFINGSLTLMITLLIWTCLHIIMDSFNITHFAKILSVSGYIFAVTVFFLFGTEEVSYPLGAIVFHGEGIAQALAIALIASLPLLKLYYRNPADDTEKATSINDDNWEPATEEDLHSDKFELDS